MNPIRLVARNKHTKLPTDLPLPTLRSPLTTLDEATLTVPKLNCLLTQAWSILASLAQQAPGLVACKAPLFPTCLTLPNVRRRGGNPGLTPTPPTTGPPLPQCINRQQVSLFKVSTSKASYMTVDMLL